MTVVGTVNVDLDDLTLDDLRSRFLTRELAAAVVEEMREEIRSLLRQHDAPCLHMVFLDPCLVMEGWVGDNTLYEECVLPDGITQPDESMDLYIQIARKKAEITARTGLSTGDIRRHQAYLFRRGDSRYAGSAIVDNIIVAVSGLPDHLDEEVSTKAAQKLGDKGQYACEHWEGEHPEADYYD